MSPTQCNDVLGQRLLKWKFGGYPWLLSNLEWSDTPVTLAARAPGDSTHSSPLSQLSPQPSACLPRLTPAPFPHGKQWPLHSLRQLTSGTSSKDRKLDPKQAEGRTQYTWQQKSVKLKIEKQYRKRNDTPGETDKGEKKTAIMKIRNETGNSIIYINLTT